MADAPGVSVARAKKLVDRLEDVGIVEVIEDGFIVVDYLNYNPSREKVLAARMIRQEAGRKAAEKRWNR
jgi:ribosomal protein L12E/L44/L45/RPP1/RPP2